MGGSALVPIADGIEELEAVTVIDLLRRAEIEVTVASVDGLTVTGSRHTRLLADRRLEDCTEEEFDLIALPGGLPGAEHLRDNEILTRLLKRQAAEGRWIGALCASPVLVLGTHGLLPARATCHSAFRRGLHGKAPAEDVVVDGTIVTGSGPAAALEFALKLIACLCGDDKARAVSAALR